ncbi:hypothetical protein Hte_008001 [Hypoxylon texense]
MGDSFCEEDYVVSIYVAEFINSLTNFAYVYFALRYMYARGPRGSRGIFAPRTDFMSISLLVLGVCSFLFHASLRQTLQFADELGMLLLAWALLQGLLTGRRPEGSDRLVNVILAIVFPLFGAFYVWTGKIIYHASAFILMVVFMTIRGHHLFYFRQPAFPADRLNVWRAGGRKALALLIVGYILWNIDLELCAELRSLRESVGLPWAWLFELHGWWHILTAWAANELMVIIRGVQEELIREKEE